MPSQIKVIKILDDETLLINSGKNQNTGEGQLFEIYEIGEDIIDPDTHKSIGTLDFRKAEVEVITAYSNFSLVKSITHYTETVTSGIMTAFADKTREVNKIKVNKLLVDPEQITPIEIKNRRIMIGDPVRRI